MEQKPEGARDRHDYAGRYEHFARQEQEYGERIRESVQSDIDERMRRHAERRRHACSGTPTGGIVIGIAIILVGLAMLLDNLGIIEFSNYWRLWPVIFVVLGATKLVESQGRGGGLIAGLVLIAVGSIWTLDNVGIIIFDPRLIWPLVIIGVGLLFLVRSLERRTVPPGVVESHGGPHPEISTTDTVQQWTVFGGGKRVVETQDFRGGNIFAMFGGIELDLRNAGLTRNAVMDASVVFGGIEVRVPPTWIVEVRGSGVFGGYEDKTLHPRLENPDQAPRLIVTGAAVFGGISIKN